MRETLRSKDLRATSRKLLYLSTHEASTGLPNKILLFDRIEHIIEQSVAPHFALIKVSLGRFDEISKTLGQTYADQILKMFAQRLCLKVGLMNGVLKVTEQYKLALSASLNSYSLTLEFFPVTLACSKAFLLT